MNRITIICFLSIAALTSVSKAEIVPSCGSEETKKSVIKVAMDHFHNKLVSYIFVNSAQMQAAIAGGFPGHCPPASFAKCDAVTKAFMKARASYEMSIIRTTAKNPNTGEVRCVANMVATVTDPATGGVWGSAKMDLAYKVEATTDDQLYITTFGFIEPGWE